MHARESMVGTRSVRRNDAVTHSRVRRGLRPNSSALGSHEHRATSQVRLLEHCLPCSYVLSVLAMRTVIAREQPQLRQREMRRGLSWDSARFASIRPYRAAHSHAASASPNEDQMGAAFCAMECKHGGWSSSLITLTFELARCEDDRSHAERQVGWIVLESRESSDEGPAEIDKGVGRRSTPGCREANDRAKGQVISRLPTWPFFRARTVPASSRCSRAVSMSLGTLRDRTLACSIVRRRTARISCPTSPPRPFAGNPTSS